DTAGMAGVWRECVFGHAVWRVGVVVSESRAWGVRNVRGITPIKPARPIPPQRTRPLRLDAMLGISRAGPLTGIVSRSDDDA
ncbi:MAG TPA: hypothetical protein VEC99_14620, partial [Clostridia bacterium]|nr:hypothetical protein [Clostridia bacterium]